ncbi:MAG: hypothetical protein QXX81_08225 [Zestosphaera sp.]
MITTSRSSRDACSEAYVLDAAAFFAAYQLYLSTSAYTVKEVIGEVRDAESLKNLQLALSAGKISLDEPSEEHRGRVARVAEELIKAGRLSKTDLELLALASKLLERCGRVVVISDDRAVQKVALKIGAETVGIKYRELKKR